MTIKFNASHLSSNKDVGHLILGEEFSRTSRVDQAIKGEGDMQGRGIWVMREGGRGCV